ncbi:hypothetical protein ACEOCU_04370, partial [Escherichia coli]
FIGGQVMLRQSDIAAAFRESILRSSKGFQYLHTRDFITALRRRQHRRRFLYCWRPGSRHRRQTQCIDKKLAQEDKKSPCANALLQVTNTI